MANRLPYDHNGPPSYDSAADIPEGIPKMHYFKCDINALWDVLVEMPFDLGGFYMRAILSMYKHMEGLPADDNVARMRLGGIDIRTYRRMKNALLGHPKCFVEKPSGRISNQRFEEEISEYVTQFRNRQKAGLETAEKQRVARETQATSGELPADFRPTSGQSPSKVQATSGRLNRNQNADLFKKDNKINADATAIAVGLPSQPDRNERAILELELELDSKNKKKEYSSPSHTTRMPRAAAPEPQSGDVWVCRPDEEEIQPGLFVNCSTIRHRGFSISIDSVALQLATANLGLSKNEAMPLARDASIAHALQWAADYDAGRRSDIPRHAANFVKGAVIAQRNREAAHQNAMNRPGPVRSGSARPRDGSWRPNKNDVADALREIEQKRSGVIDGNFERIES